MNNVLLGCLSNSDVSDRSTVVLKGFGPKRVESDCSRYRAMAKRPSDMLMYLKKLTEQVLDSLHPFQNAR